MNNNTHIDVDDANAMNDMQNMFNDMFNDMRRALRDCIDVATCNEREIALMLIAHDVDAREYDTHKIAQYVNDWKSSLR